MKKNKIKDQAWMQIMLKVGNQIPIEDLLGNRVTALVWAQAWEHVGNTISRQVGDKVRDQVYDQIKNPRR